MKFKSIYALPFVFSVFAIAANAQETPSFTDADTDQDGVLSIEEASAALPNLAITDENDDGLVNHSELMQAIEGLELPEVEDGSTAPVGMVEYLAAVQAMSEGGV